MAEFVCPLRIPSVHPLSWSPSFSQLPPMLREFGARLGKGPALQGGRRDTPWGETDVLEKQSPGSPGSDLHTEQEGCMTLGKPHTISEPLCYEQRSLGSHSRASSCTPSHSEACWGLPSTPASSLYPLTATMMQGQTDTETGGLKLPSSSPIAPLSPPVQCPQESKALL